MNLTSILAQFVNNVSDLTVEIVEKIKTEFPKLTRGIVIYGIISRVFLLLALGVFIGLGVIYTYSLAIDTTLLMVLKCSLIFLIMDGVILFGYVVHRLLFIIFVPTFYLYEFFEEYLSKRDFIGGNNAKTK